MNTNEILKIKKKNRSHVEKSRRLIPKKVQLKKVQLTNRAIK